MPKPNSNPKPKTKQGTKKEITKDEISLMEKVVATKAMDEEKIKKSFSEKEAEDLIQIGKSFIESEAEKKRKHELREKTRVVKQHAIDLEMDNRSKMVLYPSYTNGEGWYKVVEFSALYYTMRVADRMGRKAELRKDTDTFLKCEFVASIVNIGKFVEQMKELYGIEPEITEDGLHIFYLKKALTDEEYWELRRVEDTRRDALRNTVRPKNMEPAMYQAVMMLVRQVVPRVRKLESNYFTSVGRTMIRDIEDMLAIYLDFANGMFNRKEAGEMMMRRINRITVGIILLAEVRVWDYRVAAMMGMNMADVKRMVIKDFHVGVE